MLSGTAARGAAAELAWMTGNSSRSAWSQCVSRKIKLGMAHHAARNAGDGPAAKLAWTADERSLSASRRCAARNAGDGIAAELAWATSNHSPNRRCVSSKIRLSFCLTRRYANSKIRLGMARRAARSAAESPAAGLARMTSSRNRSPNSRCVSSRNKAGVAHHPACSAGPDTAMGLAWTAGSSSRSASCLGVISKIYLGDARATRKAGASAGTGDAPALSLSLLCLLRCFSAGVL